VAPHIRKGLLLLEDLVRSGETDAAVLRAAVGKYYEERIPMGRLDYLELVDPATIETVEEVRADVLAAVALRLGKARLIDNIHIAFER